MFGFMPLKKLLDEREVQYQELHQSIYRQVVLDMLDVFGKRSVWTHLFCDIDVTWAKSLIRRLSQTGQHVTMTALLLKCIALAQVSHPISRTFLFPRQRMVTFNSIVGGFTVERFIDSQPIVLFGEIEAPHEKSLLEISRQLEQYHLDDVHNVPKLEQQLRFARLPLLLRRIILWLGCTFPSFRLRYMQSTFGLSSLGSLGVTAAAGPAVCTSVFGIGAVEERVVVIDGEMQIRPVMTVSLNFNHRIMNGAQAARFLRDVQQIMENGWDEHLPISAEGARSEQSNT